MSRRPVPGLTLVLALALLCASTGRVAADTTSGDGPGATLDAAPDDRPGAGHLVAAGLAMAPAVYVLGITGHEGSHALAALALGLDITSIRLYPGFHPRTDRFYLGWVDVRGIASRGQRVAFLAAPKLTDALVIGAYAGLVLGDALPDNRYGRLALVEVATGFWLDVGRDAIAWWPQNDTVRIHRALGLDGFWQALPFRVVHVGVAALAAYPIVVGWRGVFERDDPTPATSATMIVPLWSGGF